MSFSDVQRRECRGRLLPSDAGAAAGALAKWPLVELREQLPDGLVEFGETKELPMPQRRRTNRNSKSQVQNRKSRVEYRKPKSENRKTKARSSTPT